MSDKQVLAWAKAARRTYAIPLQGKQAAALSHMMRALELDPTKEVVWRVLGMFYQKGHQRARLEQLREWYADRFGRAMN